MVLKQQQQTVMGSPRYIFIKYLPEIEPTIQYFNWQIATSVQSQLELLIPGKFISREGNKFPGTRSGLDRVSNFRSYRPPTFSRICSSFALLLHNHHRRLRRTWSVCSLPAKPTQLSFHPLPYAATNPSTCVGGRQGGTRES